MHRRAQSLIVLAALLVAATATLADEKPDTLLAEMGGEYFQQYCASCHGLAARGDGPVAAALKTPPADLTRIAARRGGTFPEGEIARHIDGRFQIGAHGSRDMPIWGRALGATIPDSGISEEIVRGKIAMLVEYLKSVQVAEAAAPEAP